MPRGRAAATHGASPERPRPPGRTSSAVAVTRVENLEAWRGKNWGILWDILMVCLKPLDFNNGIFIIWDIMVYYGILWDNNTLIY